MILKGLKRTSRTRSWMLPIVLIGTLFSLFAFKYFTDPNRATNLSEAKYAEEKYTCSAERIEGDFFVKDGAKFGGVEAQSSKLSKTGSHALKLDSLNKYGFSLKLENLVPGRLYKAQVWKRSHKLDQGYLAVSADNSDDFYVSSNTIVEKADEWWYKTELYFSVPNNKKVKTLNIHTYKSGTDNFVVWMDDFSVEAVKSIDKVSIDGFEPGEFTIQIDKKGEEKLAELKERAYQVGLLQTSDDSWIKSKVSTTNGVKEAKIRMKGDWLDHLMSGTPSFRVQLKSADSWRGMQTFSVQSPRTRNFMLEWVYHKFLEQADILTPRYDFVQMKFNDQQPRVYAYEEHFTKNLVENKLRREGPIVKFTEDRIWDGRARAYKISDRPPSGENYPYSYWSSEIKPFKEKKTAKNPKLSGSFEIAQNLMYQYQYGLKPASEIFDIELMGKYIAIVDLLQTEHSLHWHNQRFYYNPVTNLLEPIGFDGYGTDELPGAFERLYMHKVYNKQYNFIEPTYRLFQDGKFIEAYLKYLNEYTKPEFIKKFFAQLEDPLSKREKFIQKDFKDYEYDRNYVLKRALKIQEWIMPFSNSLQIFKKTIEDDKMELEVKNTHFLPLEIIHIGKSKLPTDKRLLRSQWIFPNNLEELPVYNKIEAPINATNIFYRIGGVDSVFQTKIPAWSSPKNWTPRQELNNAIAKTKQQDWYKEENDVVIFDKGNYTFEEPVVIEEGKLVFIPAGTTMKFSKGAFFLSYSAVELRGKKEQPIIIEGLGDISGAFTVMQSKQKSLVQHTIFKNQNTLNYKKWMLTGAVTFYESDVDIIDCRFIDNLCEDGLNIVRAKFEVKGAAFQGIYSDAFDADFCKGTVTGCGFKNIGNDALDFSTSKISINNCKMFEVGDKAISAGEQATISATNIEVEKANIGFASKDLSVLTLDNVTVSNSSRGFTAYQKKPEYGPATIKLKKHTIENVKFPFMIEESSKLQK